MAPHSSTLAWKIPWTEEPGRLQSMGSLRVGHDWATSLSLSCIGEGNGNPLQCSCLENPRDGGAVYGVAQSRAWLKWLSSSSSSSVLLTEVIDLDIMIICNSWHDSIVPIIQINCCKVWISSYSSGELWPVVPLDHWIVLESGDYLLGKRRVFVEQMERESLPA